jgi:putative membrane protein
MRNGTIAIVVMLMVVVAAIESRAQDKLSDGQIPALFDEANTADIWTARVALAKSQSSPVRQLATMVIADHEGVQHMARELAKKIKVTSAPPADDQSVDAMTGAIKELRMKSSGEFDRAYIAHELAFHRSAIDAVKHTLLPAAQNRELKALLTNVLGGFEHHLAETQALAGTLGVR